jgi:hypothetical protein
MYIKQSEYAGIVADTCPDYPPVELYRIRELIKVGFKFEHLITISDNFISQYDSIDYKKIISDIEMLIHRTIPMEAQYYYVSELSANERLHFHGVINFKYENHKRALSQMRKIHKELNRNLGFNNWIRINDLYKDYIPSEKSQYATKRNIANFEKYWIYIHKDIPKYNGNWINFQKDIVHKPIKARKVKISKDNLYEVFDIKIKIKKHIE